MPASSIILLSYMESTHCVSLCLCFTRLCSPWGQCTLCNGWWQVWAASTWLLQMFEHETQHKFLILVKTGLDKTTFGKRQNCYCFHFFSFFFSIFLINDLSYSFFLLLNNEVLAIIFCHTFNFIIIQNYIFLK